MFIVYLMVYAVEILFFKNKNGLKYFLYLDGNNEVDCYWRFLIINANAIFSSVSV